MRLVVSLDPSSDHFYFLSVNRFFKFFLDQPLLSSPLQLLLSWFLWLKSFHTLNTSHHHQIGFLRGVGHISPLYARHWSSQAIWSHFNIFPSASTLSEFRHSALKNDTFSTLALPYITRDCMMPERKIIHFTHFFSALSLHVKWKSLVHCDFCLWCIENFSVFELWEMD